MPVAVPLPEFVTSRRHRAAAGVGLAVIVALTAASTLAPAAGESPAAVPVAVTVDRPAVGSRSDLPSAVATATTTVPPAAVTGTVPSGPAITALAERGIPIVALQAYQNAAAIQATEEPTCHLAWTLVAAIGAIESGHGTHAGAQLYADGQDLPHVIGPVLDGTNGNASIADTDKGAYDADPVYDRAVGPMQFIPSTWARIGRDASGDGVADPFNIIDAAASTGAYLCRYGQDLSTDAGRQVAVFGYNHLDSYVATVLALDAAYAGRPVVTTSTAPAAPPAPAPVTSAVPVPSAPASSAPPSSVPSSATPPPTSPSPTCPTTTPTDPATPTTSPTTSPTPLPSGCPTPSSSVPASAAPSTSAAATASAGPSASPSASVSPTAGATPAAVATTGR